MPNYTSIWFDDLVEPVHLIDADDLLIDIPKILPSWNFKTETISEGNLEGSISVAGKNNKFCLRSPRIAGGDCRTHRVDAICGLIVEIVWSYLNSNSDLLCLHCAAAKFDDSLVVFPSTYRAGKSLLTACIANADVQIFTDDILPVLPTQDGCFGLANGIQPRLRLPLPTDSLSEEDTKFITDQDVVKSNRYCYLNLKPSELAHRGTRSRIASFILLDRQEDRSAELLPVGTADMLSAVIWQNFARQMESPIILQHLKDLVETTQKFRLVYDRPTDAVTLLEKEFAHGRRFQVRKEQAPDQPPILQPIIRFFAEDSCSTWLQRAPDVVEETADGQSFLCGSNGQSIHHLNPVASAIWQLLSEPVTEENILDILKVAFPEVPIDQMNRDIINLIKSLEDKKLIRRVKFSQ